GVVDQIRDVGEQRPQRSGRANQQLRERSLVGTGLDPALAQVDQVALGLDLTRVPQLLAVDDGVVERRRAVDDDVPGEQGAVLEGEGVERAPELAGREQQRRIEGVALPARRERTERLEVAGENRGGERDT